MWLELNQKQKEYIAKMHKLYEMHETYHKHNETAIICNCGKFNTTSLTTSDHIDLFSSNPAEYNLYLILNDYKWFLFNSNSIKDISIPILKEYQKFDKIAMFIFEDFIDDKEKEKILDFEPKSAEYIAENRIYSKLPLSLESKIVKIALQNPNIKLNKWALNTIANDPSININFIQNKIAFKKHQLLEFNINKQNLELKLLRINQLIYKFDLRYTKIKIKSSN